MRIKNGEALVAKGDGDCDSYDDSSGQGTLG